MSVSGHLTGTVPPAHFSKRSKRAA